MPRSRSVELRVGIFVLVCAVLIGGLIMRFSKLAKGVKHAYQITVTFPTVAGIVPDAVVQYAGIPVGKVHTIRLQEDGKLKVALTLAISQGVLIRKDAVFTISTSGLLGDKYIDVQPGSTKAAPLKDGDVVEGQPSVDLSEAVAHVRDVLQRAGVTIERVDKALQRLDQTVLSQPTLEHVSGALANIDIASTNAIGLVTGLRDLVTEQRAEVALAIRNFQVASSNLNVTTGRIDALVKANQPQISQTFSNLTQSSERLNGILAGLQRGEGTAGRLLVDPTLHDELVRLVQNWRRHGLLYKEGTPAPASGAADGGSITPARSKGTDGTIEFGTDLTH